MMSTKRSIAVVFTRCCWRCNFQRHPKNDSEFGTRLRSSNYLHYPEKSIQCLITAMEQDQRRPTRRVNFTSRRVGSYCSQSIKNGRSGGCTRKMKQHINANNIPNNHMERITLTSNLSTRIAPLPVRT